MVRPDFSMFSGDNLRLRVAVKDQNGTPIDVSSATAIRFGMAPQPGNAPTFTKDLTGGVFVDAADVFVVDLEPADTSAINGLYYYEADIVNSDGDTYTVLSGYVRIRPVILTGA